MTTDPDPNVNQEADQEPDQPADQDADRDPDHDSDDQPAARRMQFLVRRDPRQRLDRYLRQRLKHVSRHQVQKLIEAEAVTVNGRVAKASTRIRQDDVIDVVLPPPPPKYLQAEDIPLDVLYEDQHFIVINKQADLVVHPARSHLSGTLLNALVHHFQQQVRDATAPTAALSSVGEEEARPGVIHRLDRHTTGAMVVAKSDIAHWRIARQFQQRTPLKVYLAVVHGRLEPPGGAIDEPIGKHPTVREAYAVRHDSSGKPSVTLYRVRSRYRGYTLVELELKTGRTHQIRVHLSYLGHPLAGDVVYGGEPIGLRELEAPPIPAAARRSTTYARTRDAGERVLAAAHQRPDLLLAHPALHAALLEFTHPATEERLRFTAPLHPAMRQLLRTLDDHAEEGEVVREGFWIDLEKVKGREEGGGSAQ